MEAVFRDEIPALFGKKTNKQETLINNIIWGTSYPIPTLFDTLSRRWLSWLEHHTFSMQMLKVEGSNPTAVHRLLGFGWPPVLCSDLPANREQPGTDIAASLQGQWILAPMFQNVTCDKTFDFINLLINLGLNISVNLLRRVVNGWEQYFIVIKRSHGSPRR